MSDLLVRIPFSDDSDFSPLALAPGLPMLDGRKLAYQVLLGWFGDMLAEPDLDHDGVSFFAQSRGERQNIAEHALATQRDLDGHLAGDYERLRKALFDVRPVSPSERLIFNRLQPPIGNFDGFLYRVRPEGSSDRLVWCWGFQRHHSDGDLFLCPHADCSLLFSRQNPSTDTCPRCERALFQHQPVERRTTFPAGAVAATVMLSGLVGATYWIASVSGDEAIDALPALAAVAPPPLDDSESLNDASNANSKRVDDGETSEAEQAPNNATASGELVDLNPRPSASENAELPETQSPYGDEPLRQFAANAEPRRLTLPPTGSPFDERQLVDRVPPEGDAQTTENKAVPPESPSEPEQPALPEPAGTESDVAAESSEASPDATSSEPQQPAPQQETRTAKSASKPADASASDADPVKELAPASTPPKQQTAQGADEPATRSDDEPTVQKSPAETPPKTAEPASDWSTDYVAAYQRAIAERRFLIMLFRDPDGTPADGVSLTDLPTAADLNGLDKYVRVVVPTTMSVPGQPAESSARLLDHRSFRHLQGQSGVAIVDLTGTDSPNFGRVVSAFPAATDRHSVAEALKPAQSLPVGTISQRSLLLALRNGLQDSAFSHLSYEPLLNDLANRNSRYMAHLEQAGLFEADQRREALREKFGEDARLRELVFATETAGTIQSAAAAAVEHWRSSGDLANSTEPGITAYGLELFQSPATSRWFATLLIVTNESRAASR